MGFVRFVVLAISTLSLTAILANQNSYNFTKICVDNATDASANYTSGQKSLLQSSTAFGSLGASVPLVWALGRYPKKYVFLLAGTISTIATALIPLAETMGYAYFLVARIFQGVAFSVTFPMSGAVTTTWAALGEHGLFLAFLTGFSQLANIYLMPLSGVLCDSSLGWRSVYYVLAGVTAVLLIAFLFLFSDEPADHKLASQAEYEYITKGKSEKSEEKSPVPYRAILTSHTIWGVWLAGFGDILAIQFINMFNPQYLNDYLNYGVMNTGFLAALPVLVQWAFKIVAGISSDALTRFDETLKVRVYNSLALALSALFFVILAFMPPSVPVLCLVILILTEGFMGFNTAGFNKCATLHARKHAHFVMVQIMNIQSVCILVEPFIVNAILTDNTAFQWGAVFIVHAIVLFVANAIFVWLADGRPASWSGEGETDEKTSSSKPSMDEESATAHNESDQKVKL